ncbi:hypothetical protein B296_00005168 [Ensete ventricosum]|uniref:Uncharacterized protein n=1 Tax=Ensete ventricosum TaxID=4639 RepID=A0A427AZN8_ENSVE|nr:hypothetical protein B296_00005168 [Ensete ventricosum]
MRLSGDKRRWVCLLPRPFGVHREVTDTSKTQRPMHKRCDYRCRRKHQRRSVSCRVKTLVWSPRGILAIGETATVADTADASPLPGSRVTGAIESFCCLPSHFKSSLAGVAMNECNAQASHVYACVRCELESGKEVEI